MNQPCAKRQRIVGKRRTVLCDTDLATAAKQRYVSFYDRINFFILVCHTMILSERYLVVQSIGRRKTIGTSGWRALHIRQLARFGRFYEMIARNARLGKFWRFNLRQSWHNRVLQRVAYD